MKWLSIIQNLNFCMSTRKSHKKQYHVFVNRETAESDVVIYLNLLCDYQIFKQCIIKSHCIIMVIVLCLVTVELLLIIAI